MKCIILHQLRGRVRVNFSKTPISLACADKLEYYLKNINGITDVRIFDRTGDAIIKYTCDRKTVFKALSEFSWKNTKVDIPDHTGRELQREFRDKLVMTVVKYMITRFILPAPLSNAITVIKSFKYLKEGIMCLFRRRLEVPVLDATAISVSLIRRDFKTSSSVMLLLTIGEILEEWTHKKTVADLADAMSLNVDKVWKKTEEGQEILVSVTAVSIGDRIVVRTGNMIPFDGKVTDGEASVNEASMTGESIPVLKSDGSYAYAGTVVEEGECTITIDKEPGSGKYDRIISMIEESEKLKSDTESRAMGLADKLVPVSLGGTLLTWLLTGNITKALSILMVDFSCALKLAMPIAVLSAIREASFSGISVKGGRFMEVVSEADTIVFDKTGTLTHAMPKVAQIVTFGGNDENEMLTVAACLEEHYPHSMANAVVKAAVDRGLEHEEFHSKVEYVVAHGISSIIDDKKVIVGSYHFVFEDEGSIIPENEREKFNNIPEQYSPLYMAISGVLSAVICVEDPLREEAAEVIDSLHSLGFKKIVMMTGDSKRTAGVVAEKVGVDEYYAEVLPEDKANFVKEERLKGKKVIVIGDGINDSPALSEADVGIAISNGAAIAREVADITISADNLYELVMLKKLSDALMHRIINNYNFIISFNFMLIALGVAGVLPPTVSALLHNMSTLGIGLYSMTNLIKPNE